MLYSNKVQSSINKFFNSICRKKQYIKKLKTKVCLLNQLKETNHKTVGLKSFTNSKKSQESIFITYVLNICFSKKNTLFHFSDYLGNIKFFYSAGLLKLTGKGKTARSEALRRFYRLLISKFKFAQKVPLAVHFKNADSNMFWFVRKLKKKFLLSVITHSKKYPYNGCRKKKNSKKKI
jgi:ribosomal protein S11